MHIGIFGDRKTHLPPRWTKERLISVFSDSTLDASSEPGPGASITVISLFGDTTVHVPAGSRVTEGGFSLFGDRKIELSGGDAAEIRIDDYSLFGDLKVVEQRP